MPDEPDKRGPGRPRKEDTMRSSNATDDKSPGFAHGGPLDRLKDVPGTRDDMHRLVPAPQDPNQDKPLPSTARAVVPGPQAPDDEKEKKKVEEENERVQKEREEAARFVATRGAPIAQAALDAGDEGDMEKVAVTLLRGYFPLDGSEKVEEGATYEMSPTEAEAAVEQGVAKLVVVKRPKNNK